jgi:integrase
MTPDNLQTCSGPEPLLSARNNPSFYYSPVSSLPSLSSLIGASLIDEHLLWNPLLTCIKLIYIYGMRSAELLNLTMSSYLFPSRFTVFGGKRSGHNVIFCPNFEDCFDKVGAWRDEDRPFPFSYMQLYRACLKLGIGEHLRQHDNLARLHLGRYIMADSAAHSVGVDRAGEVLRHKSKNTVLNYLSKRSYVHG